MPFPVNQPNPMGGQQPQGGMPTQGGGALGGTGAGYTAQGPAGPIQATANTIGAASPQGLGATRSGSFAQPSGMIPSKPLIQGMDSTLGAGMPGGTYSYMFANGGMPGFADGGMPGAMPPPTPQMQGQPQQQPPMAGQMQNAPMGGPQPQGPAPTDPRMMSMQLDQVMSQNPAVSQQLVQAAAQIGITPQNAEQVSKIVMLAMQRPELYPQIRQYCIQAFGLDEADLPPQFDPQFMSTLAVLAHAGSQGAGLSTPPPPDQSGQQSMIPTPPGMQPMAGPQGAPAPQGQPQGQGQPPQQGSPQQALGGQGQQQPIQAQTGGAISGPGTGTSDSITARVSNGEFVIPADVVKAKGTEFFQKMLDQYHTKVSPQ